MALLEPLVDVVTVESSNLVSYGYDPARKTCAVWLKSGDLYHYHDVPPQLWAAFEKAPSKGKFYGMALRGKYQGVKMTGHCPKCGGLGLVGLKCEDCGCADVVADPPKEKRARGFKGGGMPNGDRDLKTETPPEWTRPVDDWTDRR